MCCMLWPGIFPSIASHTEQVNRLRWLMALSLLMAYPALLR